MTQEQQISIFIKQLENPWFALGFAVLMVWVIVWRGIALWKAAQNGSKPWFIILMIVNTFGILEIIYIFYFSKKKKQPKIEQ